VLWVVTDFQIIVENQTMWTSTAVSFSINTFHIEVRFTWMKCKNLKWTVFETMTQTFWTWKVSEEIN